MNIPSPSPEWTPAERLAIISGVTSYATDNWIFVNQGTNAYHLTSHLATIAKASVEWLEANRTVMLSFGYLEPSSPSASLAQGKRFRITTKVPLHLSDGSRQREDREPKVLLEPGEYVFERIPNPYSRVIDPDFLALVQQKDDGTGETVTKIGYCAGHWGTLAGPDPVSAYVTIEVIET